MAAIKYKCAHQGCVIIQLCRDCRKEDVGEPSLPRAKVVAVLRREADKEEVAKDTWKATGEYTIGVWHRERAFALRREADIFEAGKEDE